MKRISFSILTIMSLLSCYKDEDITVTTIIKNEPRIIIAESELVINVTDENGNALVGLTAAFNDDIKVVDKASFFHFKGNQINKFDEILQITDQNGNTYDRKIMSQQNEVNYREVSIFINRTLEKLNSNDSKSIQLSPDFKLSFSANNFLINNHQAYVGIVDMKYNTFNVKDYSHLKCLPGGNTITTNNQKYLMKFEGAFDFHFYSNENQLLSIKDQIELGIGNFSNNAHLVYYDKYSNLWIDLDLIGSAQKLLLKKTGTYAIVTFNDMSIINGQWFINNVYAKQNKVTLTANNFDFETFTSNNGKWEAIIPAGENVTIKYSLPCNSDESKIINTTSDKFDVGEQLSESPSIKTYQIKGQLKDCQGMALKEGFIQVSNDLNKKTLYVDSSDFSFALPMCESGAVRISSTSENSEITTLSIHKKSDEINLSSLFICEDLLEEYMIMSVDGYTSKYDNIASEVNNQYLTITSQNSGSAIEFKMKHSEQEGAISNNMANIRWQDEQIGGFGIELNCPNSNDCGFEKIDITYWQENGPWIKGKFQGKFWIKTISPTTATYKQITGEFQIKR